MMDKVEQRPERGGISRETQNLPFHLHYEEERQKKMRRAVAIGCGLGVILVPVFGFLDVMVAPGQLFALLTIRSVCSLNLLGLYFLNRSKLGERYATHFAVYGTCSVGVAIALMTYILGGPSSPYFAGINLTVVVAGLLTPMTIWEGSVAFLVIYLSYVLCSFPYLTGDGLVLFYNNSFFVLATMVVVLLGLRLKERLSHVEHQRRSELTNTRRVLELYTTDLEAQVREQTRIIRALFKMANQLNAMESLPDVLKIVAETIRRYTHSERVIILLRQGKEEVLSYAYGLGIEEQRLRGPRQLRLDSELMRRVGREGAAILLHEPPRPRGEDIPSALREGPWLAVGLRHSKEPFGLILAAERSGGGVYTENELQILSYIGDSASVAIHKQMMTGHLRSSYLNVVQALAYAIEAKDPYTRGHSERVTRHAAALARRIGLSDHETLVISHAAILHDVGKVEISEEILQKPAGLTDDEYTDMQDHPALGEIMLEGIPFLEEAKALIRNHHERWDGRGYPDELQGDAIPLGARIIAIADMYDALTFHRTYRRGTSKERAILHLRREKGSRLDPDLVEIFIAMIQEAA